MKAICEIKASRRKINNKNLLHLNVDYPVTFQFGKTCYVGSILFSEDSKTIPCDNNWRQITIDFVNNLPRNFRKKNRRFLIRTTGKKSKVLAIGKTIKILNLYTCIERCGTPVEKSYYMCDECANRVTPKIN